MYDYWSQNMSYRSDKQEDGIVRCLVSRVLFILLFVAFLLVCMCLSSCKTQKFVGGKDSTRVEVRTETIYVPDTVFVEIPAQKAERTTADSTSHLENDYAQSDAAILPDGSLFHSLETKPQNKPVEFQKPIERKDSIVYREKEVPVPYPVTEYVEKKLSWWQQTEIYGFYALLLLLLVMLRKPIWKAAKYMLAFL